MQWKDVGDIVGKAAPVIGSLFGPAGTAVGTLVAGALGVDNTPEAVAAAINGDPGALLKIKELELRHKERLEELQLDVLKTHLQDVQDARSRQVEHEKATGKTDTNLYVLAWTIVIGFLSLVVVLLFVKVPDDSTGVVFMLFGALSAAFGAVIQYFFGSSKSSSDKTKMLIGKKT